MPCATCKHSVHHPAEGWTGCRVWSEFRHGFSVPRIIIDAPDGEIYNAARLLVAWIRDEYAATGSDLDPMELVWMCMDKLGPSKWAEGWLKLGMGITNYCIVVPNDDSCPAYETEGTTEIYYYLPEELNL